MLDCPEGAGLLVAWPKAQDFCFAWAWGPHLTPKGAGFCCVPGPGAQDLFRTGLRDPHLALGAQDLLGLHPDPVDQGVTFYFSPSNPKQGQIVGACPLVESQLSVGQPTHPPPKQRNIYLTEIE